MVDKNKRSKIIVYPIHNEVIPQRVLPALLDPEIASQFELVGFAGRPSKSEIQERLNREIQKRKGYNPSWRSKHTQVEIGSLHIMSDMINRGYPYFQLDDVNCELPNEAYDLCDSVFIGSNNLTHVSYAIDAYKHGKDFVVEKPFAVNRGDLEASKYLDGLIRFERLRGKNLVGKITSHFAHKPASLALLKNIDRLNEKYGKIVKYQGFYEEIDDPKKPRTIATLNPHTSGGGTFTDTGCHLEMILSALGGKVVSTPGFEWDSFKGYGVETYGKVTHTVEGPRFTEGSTAEITVAKFVNEYRIPANERKLINIYFESGHVARVLFSEGKVEVYKTGKRTDRLVETIKGDFPSNEYTSIIKDFGECLRDQRPSFTSLSRGIEVSEIILTTYDDHLKTENRIKKYGQNNNHNHKK